MDMTKFNQKSKCIFSLKLAEKAAAYLARTKAAYDEHAASYLDERAIPKLIGKAIEIAWEWIDTQEGEDIGDVLYCFLDNEEDGYLLFQDADPDTKRVDAWHCIIDAIAYVSRAAYEKAGEISFPEPIELVDDDLFIHMTESLISFDPTGREYIETVYQECQECMED